LTARDVIKALRIRHKDKRQWAFFEELRVGTGHRKHWASQGHEPENPEQRIDAFVMNMYESKKFVRIAYEIKVSRSDFLHEINSPEKRFQAMQFSNQFYFVAPKGLIKPEEIPEQTGLIEVDERLNTMRIIEAPYRETEPPTWKFLASVVRRVAREEAKESGK